MQNYLPLDQNAYISFITSRIASVSKAFRLVVLMSLKPKIGEGVIYARRPIEDAPTSTVRTHLEIPTSIAHDSGLELVATD